MRTRVFLLLVVAAVLAPACGTKAEHKRRPRVELKGLLVGKTKDEVSGLLGKPAKATRGHDGDVWHYLDVSSDGGRPDFMAHVRFDDKQPPRVIDVAFTADEPASKS